MTSCKNQGQKSYSNLRNKAEQARKVKFGNKISKEDIINHPVYFEIQKENEKLKGDVKILKQYIEIIEEKLKVSTV